jgi:hypothetical protein
MRLSILLGTTILSLTFAPAPFPREKSRSDVKTVQRLEGTWIVESYSEGGLVQGGPGPKWETVRIERGNWSQTCTVNGRVCATTPYRISIDLKAGRHIDLAYEGARGPLIHGVFRLDGDRLTVTHATSGPRPGSHTVELRSGQVRWILRRARS